MTRRKRILAGSGSAVAIVAVLCGVALAAGVAVTLPFSGSDGNTIKGCYSTGGSLKVLTPCMCIRKGSHLVYIFAPKWTIARAAVAHHNCGVAAELRTIQSGMHGMAVDHVSVLRAKTTDTYIRFLRRTPRRKRRKC